MITDKDGNIFVQYPNHPFANNKGLVRYDRIVIETAFNCLLLPLTIISHINNDNEDCNLNNLKLAHPHHKDFLFDCFSELRESRKIIKKPINIKDKIKLQMKCSRKRFGKPNCRKCKDLKTCKLHIRG